MLDLTLIRWSTSVGRSQPLSTIDLQTISDIQLEDMPGSELSACHSSSTGRTMQAHEFDPKAVRYIKLGRGGVWAEKALKEGTIPFGYHAVSHELCTAESWDEVRDRLIQSGKTASGASQAIRQVLHAR